MQAQTDMKYAEYMERTKNPSAMRQYSSGVGGLLGSSTASSIKNNTISLPDLIQNKREVYKREFDTVTPGPGSGPKQSRRS